MHVRFNTVVCCFCNLTLKYSLRMDRRFNAYIKSYIRYSTYVSDDVQVLFAGKYNPENVEKGKYDNWMKSGYFSVNSNVSSTQPEENIFSLILPPPNITGNLHLGHALNTTISDILCRWKRMQGNVVLWIPGTDHAGIATQIAVEKMLFAQYGLFRQDMSQDEFLKYVIKWKEEKTENIRNQLKRIGASLDWSREIYTMDSVRNEIVTEILIRLFEDGLLYRDNILVNWCCHLQSAISDIEVEYVNIDGPTDFFLPAYDKPIKFGQIVKFALKVYDSDDEIVVSTTRLETIFGDVAVVVHPEDNRYAHLKDAYVWHPFRKCRIPVIFDNIVDREFCTGALKITPAHCMTDFNAAKRFNLPIISVIREDGTLNEHCEKYEGVKRFDARQMLIDELDNLGLLRGISDHPMKVPLCSRSHDVIENILKPQWLLKCKQLAEKANEVVLNSELDITWEAQRNVWLNWHNNIRDWCISRQLCWGHRLPLYETPAGWVAAKSIEEAKHKAITKLGVKKTELHSVVQENSVADTWFSSALLPFSVFGFPLQQNEEMNRFYPLSLMQTGQDILCFWVSRMVMLGIYCTGKVPFKVVSLHGMICDAKGRKMSKSLGNTIVPEDVINGVTLQELNQKIYENRKSGLISDSELKKALLIQKEMFPNGIPKSSIDALRLTLSAVRIKDQAINFNVHDCSKNHAFCNKIWQSSKFIIGWTNTLNVDRYCANDINPALLWHRWILSRLFHAVHEVNGGFNTFDFQLASLSFMNFFVEDLCDVAVELSKPILLKKDSDSTATILILLHCLETSLRLIAPVLPFLTEELYSYLPSFVTNDKSVHLTKFPDDNQYSLWSDEIIENEMNLVKKTVSRIRTLKTKAKVFSKNLVDVVVVSSYNDVLKKYIDVIETLSRCNSIQFTDEASDYTLFATVDHHTKVHLFLQLTNDQRADYIKNLYKTINHRKEKLNKLSSPKMNYQKVKLTEEEIKDKLLPRRYTIENMKNRYKHI